MLLFYVRHGEPTYVPDELTYLGREQAMAVCKRLALFGMDRIFSSTSTRAYQTAEPLAKILHKEVEQLDFCNEKYAYAEFAVTDPESGVNQWACNLPRIRRMFVSEEVRKLEREWYLYPGFPENRFREGEERVQRETYRFLAELGYEHDAQHNCYRAVRPNNDRIALFAHGGFGLSFLSALLDIPYPLVCTHFDMHHTGLTVIDMKEDEHHWAIPRVLTLGNDGHLYREGLPLNFDGRRY